MATKKTKKQEDATKVVVNTNPNDGPLDGASAVVNMVKTVLPKDNGEMQQSQQKAKITCSYELGVCSISSLNDKVMFTVRIDEMMQVLFSSAGAYKKLHKEDEKETKKQD